MAEYFDTRLYDAFLAAAADRDKIKVFKNQARQHPAEAAAAVCSGVPLMIQQKREQANTLYSVDLADQEWKQRAKQKHLNFVDGVLLLMSANTYLVLTVCQGKLEAYEKDTSLPKEEWATQVCLAGIEYLEATEAILLHALTEMHVWAQSAGDSAATELAQDAAAMRLAGHLATRTSPRKNKRLAKALDEIRDYNKPTGRARLEALLRELYVEAPEVWGKHSRTDWQMRATRTEAAKKLERHHKPPLQEIELANFFEREALLKRGRETGLPPREYELLRLVMRDPKRFFRNDKLDHREVAREMDLAVGTIKSLWSRIRKALAA
jgi:hypothetical protein